MERESSNGQMEEAIEVIGLMIKYTGSISVKMNIEVHFSNILLLFQFIKNYLIKKLLCLLKDYNIS